MRNSVMKRTHPTPARLPTSPAVPECLFVNTMTHLPPAALEHVARYFRTLSEPTRLRILNVLGTGEMSVGDIAVQVDSSIANVSRHLTQMAQYGLVAREHQGNSVLYRIADPAVNELCDLVCGSIARRLEETVAERAAFTPVPPKAVGGRPARR